MKINFIEINSDKKYSVDSFFLSKSNPRYTLINNLDDKSLLKFIVNQNYDKDYDEKEVFNQLLYQEGDFSDLLELLKSINEIGFNNDLDPIYVIKNENKLDHFIIAEGNRRLMCLKLISNIFKLPDFYSIESLTTYENEKTNNIYEFNDDNPDKELFRKRKNYEECNKLIEEIQEKKLEIECFFKIIDDSKKIWKSIYSKHLTGEEPGLRKWSRSKYFADLLNIFPHGISEKNDKVLRETIKRDFKQIKQDYKNAMLVYSIIYAKENLDFYDNNIKNFADNNVLSEMIKLDRVSALEKNHSFDKVKYYASKKILKISPKEFEETYFKIEYTDNCLIQFSSNKIKTDDFLKFIYEYWSKKIITTRPIKEEDEDEFVDELSMVLQGKNFRKHLSKDELNEIEEFKLTEKSLERLIEANDIFYKEEPEILERFKLCAEIKKNNKKFINLKKLEFTETEIEPKHVFKRLFEQYNYIDIYYINAKSATMRSILEQLIVWMIYYVIDNEKDKKKHIEKMMTNINLLKSECLVFINNQDLINKSIKLFFSDTSDDEQKKIIMFLQDNDFVSDVLNDFIHASHKIYLQKQYNQKLEQFKNNQEILFIIIKNLEIQKFQELNEKLINYLRIQK